MDHEAFDRLTKLLSRAGSRRAALAAGGAALLGRTPFLAAAKGKGKGKRHVKSQAKAKGKAQPTPCYPGTSCIPGKGKNTSGCDFSGSTLFFRGDFRGSNLSNSTFTGAKLAQGDFRGANLSGSCFVDTTLLNARLGASVNLDKAIFCRTRMPDGAIDDSGCSKGTSCCPTCIRAGNTCGAGIAGACCAGTDCCNGRCRAGCCPATCQSLGKACGAWPDGCEGTLAVRRLWHGRDAELRRRRLCHLCRHVRQRSAGIAPTSWTARLTAGAASRGPVSWPAPRTPTVPRWRPSAWPASPTG